MNQRRVVVTGLGVVSPLGSAVEGFWSNLCAGISGVGQITLFDASGYRSRIAGEVRGFKCPPVLPERKARRLDRFALFGLAAAFEAWQDSGLQSGDLEPFEGGVIIGSSHGGEGSMLHQVERAIHPLLGPVSPLMVPRMLDNMASAQVAITLGLQGPNFGVSSACATGGHAIGESAEIIRRGDATVMLCGGAEACITPLTLAGDEALGALSCRNDAPERASRPFDRGRDGFVLSEGAGVLVLEELSNAQSRGGENLLRSLGLWRHQRCFP